MSPVRLFVSLADTITNTLYDRGGERHIRAAIDNDVATIVLNDEHYLGTRDDKLVFSASADDLVTVHATVHYDRPRLAPVVTARQELRVTQHILQERDFLVSTTRTLEPGVSHTLYGKEELAQHIRGFNTDSLRDGITAVGIGDLPGTLAHDADYVASFSNQSAYRITEMLDHAGIVYSNTADGDYSDGDRIA
jgi:hypothetical protein